MGRKCAFVKGGLLNRYLAKVALSDKVEYRVCWWMALKVKDLKRPCKILSGRKKTDAEVVVVERSSIGLRQLRRERLNDPIKLSTKTRYVQVVLHGWKDVVIDLKKWTGQKDTFEANMRDRLKKYKKAF